MPNYANHAFQYDHYEDRSEYERTSMQRVSMRRSQHATRRRSRKRTASLGANARRNRRWAW